MAIPNDVREKRIAAAHPSPLRGRWLSDRHRSLEPGCAEQSPETDRWSTQRRGRPEHRDRRIYGWNGGGPARSRDRFPGFSTGGGETGAETPPSPPASRTLCSTIRLGVNPPPANGNGLCGPFTITRVPWSLAGCITAAATRTPGTDDHFAHAGRQRGPPGEDPSSGA